MDNKIHEFNFNIYPRKLWVTKNTDIKFLNENFSTSTGGKLLDDERGAHAATYGDVMRKDNRDLGYLVILFDNKLSVSAIAHESVHVAIFLADEVDINVDAQNQEPLAYIVGWVADCINQVKNNKFNKDE
jgi:hypothetical protein